MKIVNFGSLNIDHVYRVHDFVRPGETLKSIDYHRFCGGKGCNQSIALARAGATVSHVGKIGKDGEWLKRELERAGADVSLISTIESATGHAVIQVSDDGENSIIIHGGANAELDESDIKRALTVLEPGDFVLTQNETSSVDQLFKAATESGLFLAFNPAPFTEAVLDYPLERVSLFILNETEGQSLTGESDSDAILLSLRERFPNSKIVLTLGSNGAVYLDSESEIRVAAERVEVVDTTAAGDTFIGYFLAELTKGSGVGESLEVAGRAAAYCVAHPGAANSIPQRSDLNDAAAG